MSKKVDEPSFAEKVERFCSTSMRVILALFLLGLFIYELSEYGAWLISR